MSTVIKNRILRKAWEAQLDMFTMGKKCWARFAKKWLFKNQPKEVACFLLSIQQSPEMTPQFAVTCALQARTVKLLLGITFGTTCIHLTCLITMRG